MMSRHELAAAPTPELDDLDRKILNRLQEGFPLAPNPFAKVAIGIGCTEHELIERVTRLREIQVITRFGPFFDAAALGGAFCLCAMAVPTSRYDEVTEIVNSHSEVAHNYERTHDLNMWFVMATETPEAIDTVADAIEKETGIEVLLFPKLEEYFIGFKVAA